MSIAKDAPPNDGGQQAAGRHWLVLERERKVGSKVIRPGTAIAEILPDKGVPIAVVAKAIAGLEVQVRSSKS
jgi:hypothetical protein